MSLATQNGLGNIEAALLSLLVDVTPPFRSPSIVRGCCSFQYVSMCISGGNIIANPLLPTATINVMRSPRSGTTTARDATV